MHEISAMRTCACLLLASFSLSGQVVSLDLSPAIVESGRAIAIIALRTSGGPGPAALQWTLRGFAKAAQVEPGEQALVAKKQITCARSHNRTTCILWGRNANVIHDGIVAKLVLPGSTNAGQIRLVTAIAVSQDGRALTVHSDSFSRGTRDRGYRLITLASVAMLLLLMAALAARSVTRRRRLTNRGITQRILPRPPRESLL